MTLAGRSILVMPSQAGIHVDVRHRHAGRNDNASVSNHRHSGEGRNPVTSDYQSFRSLRARVTFSLLVQRALLVNSSQAFIPEAAPRPGIPAGRSPGSRCASTHLEKPPVRPRCGAPSASCARGARADYGGLSTAHPCADDKLAGILPATACGGFPYVRSPPHRGPGRSKARASCAPSSV